MPTRYARINFQFQPGPDLAKSVAAYQSLLDEAAVEGYADEYEIFFAEKTCTVGVSIPFEDEVSLLEAGAVLGYCLRSIEDADTGVDDSGHSSWFSIHDDKDYTLYSCIDPTIL